MSVATGRTTTSHGMTARRVLLLGHRWVGLVLGLVLALLGATGSILSFQREIDAALNPTLFQASGPADPDLSYGAILRRAEVATGRLAGSIRPPDGVWPVWVVAPARGQPGAMTAYLDPATGTVLGQRDARASFIGITRQLHETLLLREWGGHEAVGWLGVLLLLFALSGIWLWWPRQGSLGRALLTLRRRPAQVFTLDLHRLVGIWMAVVLAVVAFSGVAIIFPGWFRPLLGISAPGAAVAAPHRRGEPMSVDADAAAALARRHGQVLTGLQMPSPQRPAWQATLRPEHSDPEVRARSFIAIDPWSGAVLEERGPHTRSAAEDALALQRWLHGGALLGWPGRLLVFASGLAMPVLFVTGMAAWLIRRRKRRRLPFPTARTA